ncbi:hypothetical protein B0H14DRAFT_2666864 [Mycena olivaceomarginata]|nr:hypothetical protein B0H14DRAFT_2666864 [Mycena olivaceomarginata]
MDSGQSLATIACRIALDLDTDLSSLRRMTWTDGRRPHRCAGYVREEITLATTTLDSAVVAYDAPSPSELCLICHAAPGLRRTAKCQACKSWSHSDCAGSVNSDLICALCTSSGGSPQLASPVSSGSSSHTGPAFGSSSGSGSGSGSGGGGIYQNPPINTLYAEGAIYGPTGVPPDVVPSQGEWADVSCGVRGCGVRNKDAERAIWPHARGAGRGREGSALVQQESAWGARTAAESHAGNQ